jgi:hypothetical protein
MMDEARARNLQQFLLRHVDSFEQLETLLAFGRQPERARRVEELAGQLGISSEAAGEALGALCDRGFLIRSGTPPEFRYAPQRAELGEAVLDLASAYETHRLEIVRIMSANAVERLRRGALNAFADAFLLRKPKKDG